MSEMSEDNVIPFKRNIEGIVWSDGSKQNECSELVHIFDQKGGYCQCGEHQWDMDDPEEWETVADFRPKPEPA